MNNECDYSLLEGICVSDKEGSRAEKMVDANILALLYVLDISHSNNLKIFQVNELNKEELAKLIKKYDNSKKKYEFLLFLELLSPAERKVFLTALSKMLKDYTLSILNENKDKVKKRIENKIYVYLKEALDLFFEGKLGFLTIADYIEE